MLSSGIFSLQRELPEDFVSTISYLGSHGVHLLETNVVNLVDPATGIARYPAFSPAIGWRGSIGMSSYNGLSVSLRRPFANGLLLAANYAFTHEIDNGSNGSGDGDEISPQNAMCLSCDRSSGAWDARHVVNGNAVYKLPFGVGKSMLNERNFASAIAGNWELTTTALARTGFPVNVLMPSELHRAGWQFRHPAPRPRPGCFAHPSGRQDGGGLDQSRRDSCPSWGSAHRAAQSAARAGYLADRSRRRKTTSPFGNADSSSSARSSTTSSITRN